MISHAVYRGMMQAELDSAYDNRAHAGDWRSILDRWARDSVRLYDTRPVHRDLRYGPHPRYRIDFFPARTSGRPTMLYIHGGYWQWIAKEEESFVAEGPLARDVNVALCEYRLCPEASFDAVVADVGSALDWLAPRLAQFGADPKALFVAGSSAGAHLAATLLGRPEVAGALLVSGIYDLKPIARLTLNSVLGLDEGTARRHSPISSLPASAGPVCFAVGADELPEMIRQTRDYADAWLGSGLPGWQETIAGTDHFTVMDHLADPDGILTRALLRLCDPVAAGLANPTAARGLWEHA